MLGKQFPIPRRTVQHALVRMKHCSFISQPGCGFFEHFLHHFTVGSAAHGVGDDLAVEQVQDRREVQFAVLSFEFGHVFAVPTQCCGNAPLPVSSFMPPVGFDEEGFVGFIGVGSVLVVVVKAAFGQVCDV